MTRRVSEPTAARKQVQGVWGVEDLRKRPMPIASGSDSGSEAIEWYQGSVENYSLGTSLTAIDWSTGAAAGEYDLDAPTFAINGSGNIEIAKYGAYELDILGAGWSLAAGVDSVLFLEVSKIAGENPVFIQGALGTASAQILLRANHAHADSGDDSDYEVFPFPYMSIKFVLPAGTFPGGSPTELRVRAYVEEDGAGVSHSEPEFYFMCFRFGPTMQTPS